MTVCATFVEVVLTINLLTQVNVKFQNDLQFLMVQSQDSGSLCQWSECFSTMQLCPCGLSRMSCGLSR